MKSRRRLSARGLLWGSALLLLLGTAAALLWLWIEAPHIHEWAAKQLTTSTGKNVTIDQPISWTWSFPPTIVLKQVSVTDSSDRGSLDFARVGTIEVSIALLPLLSRSIVISFLAISDLELLLKRPTAEQEAAVQSSAPTNGLESSAMPPTLQIHTVVINRASVTFFRGSSSDAERLVLHEARMDAAPEQSVRLTANGEFRGVPIMLDATGGSLSDLMSGGSESWPVTLALRTEATSAALDGRIGLPLDTPRLDAQVTMKSDRLNRLNRLLAVEWPPLGPYSLSGRVKLGEGSVSAADLQITLGNSDLSGNLSLHYGGTRQRLSANMLSQRMDARDFSPSDETVISADPADSQEGSAFPVEWLKSWDVDLAMTSESFVVGTTALGPSRIQCKVEAGLLRMTVPEARIQGMLVNGHADIDVRQRVPTVSLALNARGLDPSLVFSALSNDVAGISDVAFSVEARGTTRRDLLRSMTISLRTNRTTLLLREPLSERDIPLSLDDGEASLNASGGRARLSGRYSARPFRLEAQTGPLSALSSNEPWPIRFGLHTGQAQLQVQGTIRLPLKRESIALEIRSHGQRLDEFASSLPAIGPFRLAGHVVGDGHQFLVPDMAWQIGQSDGKGRVEVATNGNLLGVTAQLTSHRMRIDDFTNERVSGQKAAGAAPGAHNSETLVVPKHLAAHLTWHMDRFDAGPLRLHKIIVNASADHGLLRVSGSATHPHAHMSTSVVFDNSAAISKLHVQARSRNADYGALLREAGLTDRVSGTTAVLFDLMSEGTTAEELLDRLAFQLTAQPQTLQIVGARNETAPISLSTVTLSSRLHAPVMLALQGAVRNLPLSITMTSVPLKDFFAAPAHLPWTLVLHGPDTTLDAQGRTGFAVARGTADFRLRFKGASLSTIVKLFGKDIPGMALYEFDGNVTVRDKKVTLSDFRAQMGKSDVQGGMQIAFDGSRPRFTGNFASGFIEPKLLEQLSPPADPELESEAPLRQTIEKEVKKTEKAVHTIGEGAVDFVNPMQRPHGTGTEPETRIIPDWVLPVQSFHSADVDVHWTVKHLSMPPVEMEDVIIMTTLKDGFLTVGPVAFGHHGAMTTGRLTLDGVSAVPHATIEITTTNFDYGGMLKAFRVTNTVEGSADVTLAANGNGRTLRELAGTANGSLDIIAGPAKLASRFVELWASNLMTAMLSEAWHREKFSQYHCAAAYIDIEDGEMKTDSLLIEASDHSVAAVGRLNLGTEELDVIVTPKPANLELLSLAAPIRLTGPLTAPKVSTNIQSIAASKAWQVLDVADPVGLVLLVPRVVVNEKPGGPAMTSTDNPCTHALRRGGKKALSTQTILSAGLNWFGDRLHETGTKASQIFKGPAKSVVSEEIN